MVLSGRRFLHKVNMAVRGPMEIINKDEASPCEICQKIATKKPIIFIQRWFMFPFPLFTLPERIKTKISRFVCGRLLFFSFLCCIHCNQINTILNGKPNVGSCTGFAESKLPSYENFRFCLCGGKKKDGLILKSQSFMKYDKCH